MTKIFNLIKEEKIFNVGLVFLILFEIIRWIGVSEDMFYAMLFTSLLTVLFFKLRGVISEVMLDVQHAENKDWVRNYLKSSYWFDLIGQGISNEVTSANERLFVQELELVNVKLELNLKQKDWDTYLSANNIAQLNKKRV